jgi:Flp pilus assembly protein TadB
MVVSACSPPTDARFPRLRMRPRLRSCSNTRRHNAEKLVDVARVALLRLALELQARHGDGVKRFLRSLAATVGEAERELRGELLPEPEGE